MEENEIKVDKKEKGHSIIKLDLRYKNITYIDTSTIISPNLTELYLSNNSLNEVPAIILNLKNVRVLDLSFNSIEYFDDTPKFCDVIEYLNIANNKLLGPPYWIWAANPNKIIEINLSSNSNITQTFQNGYFEEILQYKSQVRNIIIYNCKLKNHAEILETFPKAKVLEFGTSKPDKVFNANRTEEVLWKVLENCDIEIINLSNTSVFEISSCIGMYRNLIEIDLSFNEISRLPEEFCDLENLEVCILSHNYIMYLPERFYYLEKLIHLVIDNNELCKLPDYISKLRCLKRLDLYNNFLDEEPDGIENVLEIDLAMNYFEEPNNEEYLRKKLTLRTNHPERFDGSKELVDSAQYPNSEHSCSVTDDELVMNPTSDNKDIENRSQSSPEDWDSDEYKFANHFTNFNVKLPTYSILKESILLCVLILQLSRLPDIENRSQSSPEDWDSDEYWVPHISPKYNPPQSPWIFFVKQKMTEGNFCPSDAHMVSIADQVKYEKLCNPTIEYEVDGQFDDLSDDNS